jgi:outer membrane protein TolC
MMQKYLALPDTYCDWPGLQMASRKVCQCLLLVLAISHTGLTLAANTNQVTVSFNDAWLTAQSNSDFLASKQSNVERAQLKQDALRGLSFPRVDLIGTYTHLDDTIQADALKFNPLADLNSTPIGQELIGLIGGPDAFRTDFMDQNFGRIALSAVWPVYTGGRVTAAREAGAAQTDVAKQQKDIQTRTLFEELVRAYFGVSLAQQNLQIHQQTENDLGLHLDNAVKLEAQGQIAVVERLSVAAVYERTKVARERARRQLEITRIALAELLLQDPATDPSDSLFINQSLPAEEAFLTATLDNSPLLKELAAHDRQAAALVKAEQGRFHPEVFLFADWEVYKDNSLIFDYVPDWQVGVGINFTLLDRVGRSKSIAAANKTRDSVTSIKQGTKRFLDLAARVAYREANQALSQYGGLNASLELGQENLRLRNKAFVEGFSTSVELVDAELFVAAVKVEQSAAAYAYIVSLARLLALTGEMESFTDYLSRGIQLSSYESTTLKRTSP